MVFFSSAFLFIANVSNKESNQFALSSIKFTILWKSFQRFNNSILAGAKALNFFSANGPILHTARPFWVHNLTELSTNHGKSPNFHYTSVVFMMYFARAIRDVINHRVQRIRKLLAILVCRHHGRRIRTRTLPYAYEIAF